MNNECSDIPASWAITNFGSLGAWGSGGTPSRKDTKAYGGSIPWLKIGDLQDGPVHSFEESITEHGLLHSSAKWLDPETLLIAMYGASIGKLGITTMRCTTNQAIASCRPFKGINLRYLFYFALSNRHSLIEKGQGGAQPNISQTILKDHQVPLAPEKEQARIASKIDELFSRIEEGERALERVQKLVERYRQSVLKAAVTGELTREWREKQTGKLESGEVLLARILKARREAWEKSELDKMKAKGQKPANDNWKRKYKEPAPPDTSELPDLPEGWIWASLDQVSIRVTDGTHQPPPFASQGVPFLTIQHLSRGRIHWDEIERWVSHDTFLEYTKSMRPMSGDVLYSAVGSYGIAAAVKDSRNFMFQRHIAHIRPIKDFVAAAYLETVLNSPAIISRANKVARGVAQKTVTLGDLREFPIPMTSFKEQQTILDHLAISESAIAGNFAGTHQLSEVGAPLRQAILKLAFSGGLVAQDSADEPASILLERIASERNGAVKNGSPKRGRKKRATA